MPERHRGLRRAAWLGRLSAIVALVSLRYVAHVGPMPRNIAASRFVQPWIAVHAGGAATALLVGPWQFLPGLRRHPRLRRWLGRAYVAGCGVGRVAAMLLAAGTLAGPVAVAGFITLDLWWLTTTGLGTVTALKRRHAAHRRWMIRSMALTVGAVTLRLCLPVSGMLGIDSLTACRVIAWLAWVPNAMAAEVCLHRPTRSAT